MVQEIKKKLIFIYNKFSWHKKMLPKMVCALWDDSVGYLLRQMGIGSKFKRLKGYKNKFQGKRCFIISTGPSLTMEDVEAIKNEYTFGVNSVVNILDQMSYVPTFYAIQDGLVYEKLRTKICEADFKHAFIADWKMKKEFFKDKDWIRFPLYISDYFWSYPEGDYHTKKFSEDAYKRVYDGFSITYSAIQLAVYMGFKEIYLLGSDCNYEKGVKNFADYRNEKEIARGGNQGEKMIHAFEVAAEWTNTHDVKIYNATRGGMLEAFPRVRLEDVLQENDRGKK